MRVTEEQALAYRFRIRVAAVLAVLSVVVMLLAVVYVSVTADFVASVAGMLVSCLFAFYSRRFADPRRVGIR